MTVSFVEPLPNYPQTNALIAELNRSHPDPTRVRRIGVLADLIIAHETGVVDPSMSYPDISHREMGMDGAEVERARQTAEAHIVSDPELNAARQTHFEDIGTKIMKEMKAPHDPNEGMHPHPDFPLFE